MSEPQHDELNVLVLQGGGALGSYQAGVFEALRAGGQDPGWVAGISIGAINAALIAGNSRETRIERLRSFWETVSSANQLEPVVPGERARALFNEASAGWVAAFGVPGFFTPRWPSPFLSLPGTPQALSFYDTAALRTTLERLIDFDRINAGEIRLSVGAVNVRTGNFAYFDSARESIGPEHIMASGALPPGLPPVEIKGEFYWDGGLVSNTPLDYVLDQERTRDLRIFQVDLFSARGPLPRTILEVGEREKDIRYSSRTRLNTDNEVRQRRARAAFRRLTAKMPAELRDDPDLAVVMDASRENAVTLMHVIYRRKNYENGAMDYEFSRRTMLEHWAAGLDDVRRALGAPAWVGRAHPVDGVAVFDLTLDGPE